MARKHTCGNCGKTFHTADSDVFATCGKCKRRTFSSSTRKGTTVTDGAGYRGGFSYSSGGGGGGSSGNMETLLLLGMLSTPIFPVFGGACILYGIYKAFK